MLDNVKKRDKNQKEMQSMPDDIDILVAGQSVEGTEYSAIMVYNLNFPDDIDHFKICNQPRNLSALNSANVDEMFIPANFTYISIPAGSEMIIVAYKR